MDRTWAKRRPAAELRTSRAAHTPRRLGAGLGKKASARGLRSMLRVCQMPPPPSYEDAYEGF